MPRIFENMNAALLGVARDILGAGSISSPRNMLTKELLAYSFTLSNPRARTITIPCRKWSQSIAIGELCWHLSGSDALEFIEYYAKNWRRYSEDGVSIIRSCYGKKIFSHSSDGVSAWNQIIEMLKQDIETRRAVLSFIDNEHLENADSVDVSCISTIQFIARSGFLHCVTSMRSNDVIWGMCYDVFFVTMLQELMAKTLNLELGTYTHFAGSIHVYEYHWTMLNEIASIDIPPLASEMPEMDEIEALPLFLIAEEMLRHHHPDATKYTYALPEYWRKLAEPLIEKHSKVDLRI